MKKLAFVFPVLLFGLFVRAQDGTGPGLSGKQELLFERAVACIKHFDYDK